MLSTENRLTQKDDFERIKQNGKFIQSESLALGFIDNLSAAPPRFGFIVSTKISKKATLRNRVKRAMREAVRQNLSYVKKGIDGVFLAKTPILNKPTPQIMVEVKEVLNASGICK